MPKIGIVQKCVEGEHGSYAIALVEGVEGSVTFSLGSHTWKNQHPKPGEYVVLENLVKKRAGWRAEQARYLQPEDEQTARDQEVIKLRRLIDLWRNMLFTDRGDAVWQAWIDLEPRGSNDLYEVIDDKSLADELRARAILIMLVPKLAWNPFPWTERLHFYDYGYVTDIWQPSMDFSERLGKFTLELLELFIPYVNTARFNQELANKKADYYNEWVLELMATLSERLRPKAYQLYSLRNHISGYAHVKYSEYVKAMTHQRLPSQWKAKIDKQMQDVVIAFCQEDRGKTPYEKSPLSAYHYLVEYCDSANYSCEIFASQLEFLLEVLTTYKIKLGVLDIRDVSKAFSRLASHKGGHLDLRRRLAKQLFSSHDFYGVYDQRTLEGAKALQQVLESGSENQRWLAEAIAMYQTEKNSKKHRKQEGVAILKQMSL